MVRVDERRGEVPASEGWRGDPPERLPNPGAQEKPQREAPVSPPSGKKDPDNSSEGRAIVARKGFIRRHPFLSIMVLLALIALAVGGYLWWSITSQYVTTDDAFIQARFFTVSPKVSGYIVNVPVTDNEEVKAGQLLTVINSRDYDAALAQAEAQVEQAQAAIPNIDAQIAAQQQQIVEAQTQINDAAAALKFAEQQNNRAQALVRTGAGTVQAAQQTESQLIQAQAAENRAKAALIAAQKQLAALKAQRKSAEASIAQAMAQRAQAQLNLSYTKVTADQAGRVTQLTASKGQLAQAGQSLMAIVPDVKWVVANFRETEIYKIHPGQRVSIHVDAYPNRTFHGHVDSIQSGSGTAFSLLPAENATGNYVKVVQRVPVKIDFNNEPNVVLGPGMSVEPKVYVK